METPDVNNAASSTATLQEPSSIDLSSLTSEQRQTWRATGELPAPKKSESAPSAKKESEAEVPSGDGDEPSQKSAPASEAGKHQEKPRSNAETRLQEILADLKRAGLSPAELKSFKREAAKAETPAESLPAAKNEPKPAQFTDLKKPIKPKMSDYDGSAEGKSAADYEEAMEKYFDELSDYKAEIRERERTQRETVKAGLTKLQSEIEEAAGRYENFTVKDIDDAAGKIYHDSDMNMLVKQAFMESDVLIDLLYTLNGEDGGIDAFVKEAKASPTKAMKRVAVLESLIREEIKNGTRGKAEAKADTKEADDEGEQEPAAKKATPATRTNVPPPVKEVGGRGTVTEDIVTAAARSGFQSSTKDAWNRDYLARKK